MHNAKLIWITPDAEKLVGKIARVSNPANEDNPDVSKLLKYLIKHKHWSPFEMASMCVEIKTTRAIAAQILRHRSFSFQEFSQRYAPASEIEMPLLRRQDDKNRQNSIDDLPAQTIEYYEKQIDDLYNTSMTLYESMIHSGVAKECARAVLPMNTVSRIYMSGTLPELCRYRGDNGTQLEHQSIARAIGEILDTEVPTIARAMWG